MQGFVKESFGMSDQFIQLTEDRYSTQFYVKVTQSGIPHRIGSEFFDMGQAAQLVKGIFIRQGVRQSA